MRQTAEQMITGGTLAPGGLRHRVTKEARGKAYALPTPGFFALWVRTLAWALAIARYELRVAFESLVRRRPSRARRAFLMRQVVQSMDTAAVHLVRLFALRLDVLPLQYSGELSRLTSDEPPMPIGLALERIEQASGAILSETYERIDSKPIASDVVSCVYQARLRAREGEEEGRRVVLRVQQPHAALRLNTERLAMIRILSWAALFWPERAEMLAHVAREIEERIHTETDFIERLRLQRILRRRMREDKLKGVGTVRIHRKLCDPWVIVSGFASGVWLHEVLAAVESEDPDLLRQLAAMDIEPRRCGSRLLYLHWWSLFESHFYFASAQDAQIVVRPGGELVLVELGACRSLGLHQRRLLWRFFECLHEHDVEGAVEALLSLFAPLPRIDVEELKSRLEARIWDQLMAVENRDAPWWERSGTGLWLETFRVARRYGLTVDVELSRAAQANCIYSNLACRLTPGTRLLKELRRYRRRYIRRSARRAVQRLRRPDKYGGGRLFSQPAAVAAVLQRFVNSIESSVERLPLSFLSVTKKGAYSAGQTVGALVSLGKLTLLLVVFRMGYSLWIGQEPSAMTALLAIVTHPAYLLALIGVALSAARRVLFRLEDLDQRD